MANHAPYDYYESSDIIHRTADICMSSGKPRDYGNGELYTSAELHILKYLVEHPGITATQFALEWNKTRGAVVQMITKLEKAGLVYRSKETGNGRKVPIYPTEKGLELNELHRAYDTEAFGRVYRQLAEHFSDEAVQTTLDILQEYAEILRCTAHNAQGK